MAEACHARIVSPGPDTGVVPPGGWVIWLRPVMHILSPGPDTGVEEEGEEEDGGEEAVGEPGGAAGMEEAGALDAATLRGYKEGVVDLLRAGESVLGALRRLGGLQARPLGLRC